METDDDKTRVLHAAPLVTFAALALLAYVVSAGPMLACFLGGSRSFAADRVSHILVSKIYSPLAYAAPELTLRYVWWCESFFNRKQSPGEPIQ